MAAGDIGVADAVHDLGREARAVVGDGDADLALAPVDRHVDLLAARNRPRSPPGCRARRGSPDCARRSARPRSFGASATLMATPKWRCGATTSSISADSGMRSNGSTLADSSVSLPRICRQRCACSRSSAMSSASGESASIARSSSVAITVMVASGVPSSCAAAAASPSSCDEVLLARQHELGRRQRVGELARLLGELPGVHADEAERRAASRARRPRCRPPAIAAAARRRPTAAGSSRTRARWRRPRRTRRASAIMRGGSAVADSSTGPSSRNANGFCNPPVRKSSTAISAMSKANSQAARSGSSRWVARKRTRSATLSQAASAITARQA